MFDQLVESHPARSRNLPQTIFSITMHTLIIAASIQLTRAAAESVVKRPVETTMTLARARTPTATTRASAAAPSITSSPAIALPAIPTVVALDIPTVDLSRSVSEPPQFGTGSGHASALIGDAAGTVDPLQALTATEVDEPVQFLEGPLPIYPPALRQVGIEGRVTVRYIIDADGRVEPASVQVIQSSNRSFEEPALQAIRAARFRPARRNGQVVRQLVEQVVRFTIR